MDTLKQYINSFAATIVEYYNQIRKPITHYRLADILNTKEPKQQLIALINDCGEINRKPHLQYLLNLWGYFQAQLDRSDSFDDQGWLLFSDRLIQQSQYLNTLLEKKDLQIIFNNNDYTLSHLCHRSTTGALWYGSSGLGTLGTIVNEQLIKQAVSGSLSLEARVLSLCNQHKVELAQQQNIKKSQAITPPPPLQDKASDDNNQAKILSLERQCQQMTSLIERMETSLKQLEASHNSLQESNSQLTRKNISQQARLAKLEEQMALLISNPKQKEISALKAELSQLREEVQSTHYRCGQLIVTIQELSNQPNANVNAAKSSFWSWFTLPSLSLFSPASNMVQLRQDEHRAQQNLDKNPGSQETSQRNFS